MHLNGRGRDLYQFIPETIKMFSAANPVRVPLKNSEGYFELE